MITALLWLACRPADEDPSLIVDTSGPSSTPGACEGPLHTFDPDAAQRGRDLFVDGELGRGLIPPIALRNLWAVWGSGPIPNDAAFEVAFRDRYGLVEAPWPNESYPLGLHLDPDTGGVAVNCLLCHADRVAGQTVVGVGNSRLDVQALWDDLCALNDLSGSLGLPSVPLPYELIDRTAAAGTVDAMGIAMELSLLYGPPGAQVETRFGAQQAPAWWQVPFHDALYTDGSGHVDNPRTMAATLLAFGTSWSELQAMDPVLADLQAMVGTAEPPQWPFPVDLDLAAEGRLVYDDTCASCHGPPCGPAGDVVVPAAEVGTDPLRATRFTEREAAWVNLSWFGAPEPMLATGGYLAPSLRGVWATAPYLHNGSVPDLRALLDPTRRPAVWQRTGAEAADYDPEAVGWRYTTPAPPADRDSVEARRVYDTGQEGLSNAGHLYGAALGDADREALLAFLVTL